MTELLPGILYVGLFLNALAFLLLFLVANEKKKLIPVESDLQLKESTEEEITEKEEQPIVEEETVEEVIESKEEIVEEVKEEIKIDRKRELVDTVNILKQKPKDLDEEVEEEFDMHVYEPLKYDRGVPKVDEKEEEKGNEIEKRLEYHSKKIDYNAEK